MYSYEILLWSNKGEVATHVKHSIQAVHAYKYIIIHDIDIFFYQSDNNVALLCFIISICLSVVTWENKLGFLIERDVDKLHKPGF